MLIKGVPGIGIIYAIRTPFTMVSMFIKMKIHVASKSGRGDIKLVITNNLHANGHYGTSNILFRIRIIIYRMTDKW